MLKYQDFDYKIENGEIIITGCRGRKAIDIVIPSEIDGMPVRKIKDQAFARKRIAGVVIPDNVTDIGNIVFSYCSSLVFVSISDSVTNIGIGAFRGCGKLESVTIPNGVMSIGDYVFEQCSSLVAINVSSDNKNYSSKDGVLFNKNKTELICCPGGKKGSYTIPDSVTRIGDNAFAHCHSITSIEIPDSVMSIGDDVFSNCSEDLVIRWVA